MHQTKKRWDIQMMWNNRTIAVISTVLFLAILSMISLSSHNMNHCVEDEAKAQSNRYEMENLGEVLADGSDYLTEEVRKFAVTGEMEHLFNYWHEVYVTKSRDLAVEGLKAYEPLKRELKLLEEAKSYSDELILTETCAMKLRILSEGIHPDDYKKDEELWKYLTHVMVYNLPKEYQSLTAQEQKEKALELLYGKQYHNVKNQIMGPIEEFQITMNKRLNLEVKQAIQGREGAVFRLNLCMTAAAVLIIFLFFFLNRMYIKPINLYTEELEGRITPRGAYEVRTFGQKFNIMAQELQQELTRRSFAEEKMRKERDRADKANAAKTAFLASMSHELRTPLNALIGYLYLLKKENITEKSQRYADSMNLAAENLLSLIHNILDFSKIESQQMEYEIREFSVREMMKEVEALMASSARQKGLLLTSEIDERLSLRLKGDDTKLKQILVNLVGNAVKFTEKGSIHIEVESVETDDEEELAEFRVSDTGIGISETDQRKIFRAFVQSDAGITRKYGGTGLGLLICRKIIEEISAGQETLQLKSREGEGSCFYFRMRFAIGDADSESSNVTVDEDTRVLNAKQHLLLVDDNVINLSVEREIIESYGLRVDIAKSGKEALEKIYDGENDFDMILMDIRMPDMSGYEVAGKIREMARYRYVPVIALTADVVKGVSEKVKAAGMNYYATKPLKPDKLYRIIQKYLSIAVEAPEKIYQEQGLFAVDECLSELNGNEKNLCRLLEIFLESHLHKEEDIYEAIACEDYEQARGLLHDVEGVLGSLCCHDLYRECLALHRDLREGRPYNMNVFVKLWKSTMTEVQNYYDSHKSILYRKADKKKVEVVLDELKQYSQEKDLSALDVFYEYEEMLKNHMEERRFSCLRQALTEYQYKEAERLLDDEKKG